MLAPEAFVERAGALGPHYAPQARRIIFLFMNGAPSQQDLFDYKPVVNKYHGEELFKRYNEKTGKWSDRGFVKKTQRLTGMTAGQSSFPISRSKFKFRQYGESRAWVSEVLPHTARMADDLCFVKSMHTEAINHDPGVTFFQTGHQQPGRPSMGAWLGYGFGTANKNLPTFCDRR